MIDLFLENIDYEEERKRLVERLVSEGYITSDHVKKAFLRVPREEFVPQRYKKYAYVDQPLPIGYGQTISAPHMVALMTEKLRAEVGNIVLEIGTGSGYQAAILAEIVAPSDEDEDLWGHVYTIERIPELAMNARRNLERTGYANRVTVIIGDGTKGYKEKAPYDRIIVTAAAPKIPDPLVEQLKPGGIMVIPVGNKWLQRLYIVRKDPEGRVFTEADTYCVFVPLVGEHGWKNEYREI